MWVKGRFTAGCISKPMLFQLVFISIYASTSLAVDGQVVPPVNVFSVMSLAQAIDI
jgi:hypothetical protein